MPDEIEVVLQPIGRTPGVLEAPLAKYKPQIVVLFTSLQLFADVTISHMENAWRKHTRRMPEVIVKIISQPWTSDTVDRYMELFDEAVSEIESRYSKSIIKWHVGTAGGTNLMAIASAISGFTHRFPVYTSLDSAHNPTLEADELAIEVDLFTNLGPGFKALQKPRSMKIMRFIAANGPVQTDAIIKHLNGTKQNESSGRTPLVKSSLIIKTDHGWVTTNVGRALLALMAFEEE